MQQERVRAQPSPLRCPFCHEGVEVDSDEWVACTGCLARHHDACWGESGACAACGETSPLSGQEVGTQVEAPPEDQSRAEIERLIGAHQRESDRSIVDYLLAAATGGFHALLKAERRLIAHVDANVRALPEGDLSSDVEHYRSGGLADIGTGARRRLGATALIFGLCLLMVIPVLLLVFDSPYRMDNELGIFLALITAGAWWLWSLVASALHWRAVHAHDSKQLYVALRTGQTSSEDAEHALSESKHSWARHGKSVALGTLASTIVWPLLPLWLAHSSRAALDLHEEREDSIAKLQIAPGKTPPPTGP